jgi:chromosome segregation ATPase
MSSEDLRRKARRWSGREEAPRLIREIGHRAWFFLIPLVAVFWVTSKKIEPKVHTIQEQIQQFEEETERKRLGTLAAARTVNIRISMIRALADTFQIRFDQIGAVMDSVYSAQSVHRAKIADLRSILDSLRAEQALADGAAAAAADSLATANAVIDSLERKIPTIVAQRVELEALAEQNRDLTDRILNPNKYHRNRALIMGATSTGRKTPGERGTGAEP